jgi:ribonuclease D
MDHITNGYSYNNKDIPLCMFVKNKFDLVRAYDILAKEKVMGVDLESDSMFHYREKVCLLQISVSDLNILIDTLSISDLSPLFPIFSNPEIRKVFHGADYDIRSLFRDFTIEVKSLFDTQIAAKLLGMTQTGLSSILEDRFGICLEKKFQKSDWSRRPISREMLQYAIQDTYYLISLSRMFEKELKEKGRFSWFEEECELESRVRFSFPKKEPLYSRIKGASKLPPRNLAIIDEILKWREALALRKDIPPFKIISNQQILEIAETKPLDMDGLDVLSKKQISSIGKSILDRIQSAMDMPEDSLPAFPKEKRQKHSAATLKKISALKEWRERSGKKSGLDPSII